MAEPADLVENEAELSGSDASSDSNDEEPEETEADRAFVVDGPVEEPDESSDSSDGSASSNDNEKDATSAPKKKRRREDEDLDEEDLSLVEEFLGRKIKRKKKFSRVKIVASDEEDEVTRTNQSETVHDRETIASHLFDDEGSDQGEEAASLNKTAGSGDTFGALPSSSEEEDDVDDFIVDEEGRPVRQRKKRTHKTYSSAQLQEAQDIFGVDLAQFADDLEEEGDEDEEEEEEEDEEDEEYSSDEEGRPRVAQKKGKKRRQGAANVYDLFEPSELERRHFTDRDDEIRAKDVPERFQLRSHPVEPSDEENNELRFESEWIYRHAFSEPPISDQRKPGEISSIYGGSLFKSPSTIPKIRDALNFMRNELCEVPFIANYRKEYVEPELSVEDLWKIWQWDERWCKFQVRKKNMSRLFLAVQQYQRNLMANPDYLLPEGQRLLSDRDLYRIDNVQSLEELKDVYEHFSLHFGNELAEMRKSQSHDDGSSSQLSRTKNLKVSHKDFYTVCWQAGLLGMAEKFGLTAEQFGENLRDNYQRHETEQYPNEPEDVAEDYICQKFSNIDSVVKGVVYTVAIQLSREPLIRQTVRQTYSERAKVSVKPTKRGKKEIDEWHECSSFKYLKNKPVKTLRGDQFLRMSQAEQDGLLKISISIDMDSQSSLVYGTYLDEIKQLFYRDEFSLLVEKWNDLRVQAVEMAVVKFLYPVMEKELRRKLLQEAQDYIIQQCAMKLQQWISVASYQPEQQLDEDEFDGSGTKTRGLRVLTCTFEEDRDTPVVCAVLNGNGQLMESLRMSNIRIRPNSLRKDAKKLRDDDLEQLREFILKMRPYVVAVAAQNRDALFLIDDIRQCLIHLEQEHQLPTISVELVDGEVARIYQSSQRAKEEFPDQSLLLRQAVSLGRRLQDPLLEFAGLCNDDKELLCLRLHPLQGLVSQEHLITQLQMRLIDQVNDVGVDVNRALEFVHYEQVVQFVCGLGPRKAAALLRTLRQKRSLLENRSQLVTICEMGPHVLVNCAAFVKIDSLAFSDNASDYTEVLDGSRIHPEAYEWARKMAIDALEYDESAEDAPRESIEEILESPDKLKDLDLDAFAEELARQKCGNRQTTLYDIRDELFGLYRERRKPYRPLTLDERFRLMTGETGETLQIGKLIVCTVSGIVRKKLTGEVLDNANLIVRSERTNLYQCPFCMVDEFQDLSAVWSHLDDRSCPGQAIGVRTRLDNGITGFIALKNLSDRPVRNPEERVKEGMSVHCRILRLNMEKFQVDLTSRSQDLADKDGSFGSPKDAFFDNDAAMKDADQEKKLREKPKRTYVKRVIAHPAFQNVSFEQAIQLLANMDLGECVIRPSSKGDDHLTITWKVDENLYQHIDVTELGKENAFSLGRTLRIGSEEYEDLDEIIARHIQPMASLARDLFNHRYYRNADGGSKTTLDKLLSMEKKRCPSRIPYFFSASQEYPGRFLISYMPRTKSRHEFVSVTPDGYRFRGQVHMSVNTLIQWFKEHFRDPPPAVLAANRGATTGGNSSTLYSAGYQSTGQPFSNTPIGGGWVDRPAFSQFLRH